MFSKTLTAAVASLALAPPAFAQDESTAATYSGARAEIRLGGEFLGIPAGERGHLGVRQARYWGIEDVTVECRLGEELSARERRNHDCEGQRDANSASQATSFGHTAYCTGVVQWRSFVCTKLRFCGR